MEKEIHQEGKNHKLQEQGVKQTLEILGFPASYYAWKMETMGEEVFSWNDPRPT
jgi:hypothetical protein